MLLLVSPAKTLDYTTPLPITDFSQPEMLADAQELIDQLQSLSPAEVASLMSLSDKLAHLNTSRFQHWQLPFNQQNARPAIYAFKGDVYTGLDAYALSASDMTFAQSHLRMLSGLYGLLKPLDLMQAYRLEMGTKYANSRGKNLYEFWGNSITDKLNEQLSSEDVLLNLASNEYFKAVNKKRLQAQIITPVFKDEKNGQFKIISFYAKKARGMMAAYVIKNRIKNVDAIKQFDSAGYEFNEALSNAKEWVFTRAQENI
ncbi:MAG: peroxide stress protein YaaA [Bermanella sp.]